MPETILVQSPGMSEWLKIQLAERLGIAANLHFPLPSSYIWNLYKALIPDVPETSAFNKDRLRWKIYQLLPNLLDDDDFTAIADYLTPRAGHFDVEFEQLKRFQLAEKIADAYDNYLMYRPEWLSHWQQGHNDLPQQDDIQNQQWQAKLWRAICTNVVELGQSEHHRANLHTSLLAKLQNLTEREAKQFLPKQLFVFGISTLPKHQLEILCALSRWVNVNLLWLNPCCQYWGDIVSEKTLARLNQQQGHLAKINAEQQLDNFVTGNPLLASWGKIGKDYLDSLAQLDIEFEDLFIQGDDSTLLRKIQNDILNLEYRSSAEPLSIEALNSNVGKLPFPTGDDSVQIHSCHSRFRELEVLKDKLLHWFENEPISAKDIIVMVPNIEDYAPFIETVFAKNQQQPELTIPYSISDRSSLAENPVLNTFVSLLGLPTSRFQVREILDWLEVPVILHAFDMLPAELELLKTWIADCEIKWGLNAEHKTQWQMPKEEINTWLYGLKRMMLGFSLGEDSVWHDTAPYTSIEGLSVNIVGKLVSFLSYLNQLKQDFSYSSPIEGWHERIEHMITELFDATDIDAPYMLQKLRDANQQLLNYQLQKDSIEPINNLIVQQFFKLSLSESGVSQRFLAGKVNFCTLMPMRSVPFDIVCVLGLNDGEFPRHVEPLSFDLVGLNQPRKGDRARKLDERYLFLEAINSARNKLHLSFIGQSSKNNEALMPSVLLSELIDYLDESYIVDNLLGDKKPKKVKDQILIQHGLQPFNTMYFVDNQSPNLHKSYNKQWFDVCSGVLGKHQDSTSVKDEVAHNSNIENSVVDNTRVIELDDLVSFAANPIRHFYRQQLGFSLTLEEQALSDVESFEHTGLQKYQYVAEITNKLIQNDTINQQALLKSGAFPPQQWGVDLLKDYETDVSNMERTIAAIKDSYKNQVKSVSSRQLKQTLELNNAVSLSGNLVIEEGVCFQRRLSKNVRVEDLISAWLQHLFRALTDKPGPTFVVSQSHSRYLSFTAISKAEAKTLLADWITHYQLSTQVAKPFIWYGRYGLPGVIALQKGADKGAINKVVMEAIAEDIEGFGAHPETHIIKHFGTDKPIPDKFIEYSNQLLTPMLNYQADDKMKNLDAFLAEYAQQSGLGQ